MMKSSHGKPVFPIWLIGDSNPKNWEEYLKYPFDPRHPIVHNIWTSVLDVVQRELYKKNGKRLNAEDIYIRNAIKKAASKPKGNEINWSIEIKAKQASLKGLINKYKPTMILTFGAFAYEFVRRVRDMGPERRYGYYWTTAKLSAEFGEAINNFDVRDINIFPLLHRSIAGRYLKISHQRFSNDVKGNYFEYVGVRLAKVISDKPLNEKIFVSKMT